jgi:hypothetical protein
MAPEQQPSHGQKNNGIKRQMIHWALPRWSEEAFMTGCSAGCLVFLLDTDFQSQLREIFFPHCGD